LYESLGHREEGSLLTSVSAFFPCYNDSKTIANLVRSVEEALRGITADYEIVVVDDGSSDDSLQVAEALIPEIPRLRIVKHGRNRGYGAALTSGFRACTKEFIFYTDGDGQYDPSEITTLAQLMTTSVDVVNGYKRSRQDPWHRRLVGSLYQHGTRWLFSLPIRDVDCDFRLIRRDALSTFELESSDGAICVELVRKLRDSQVRMTEVPVSHYVRAFGTSQFFKPVRIVRALRGVAKWYVRLVLLQEQKRRYAKLSRAGLTKMPEEVEL
jgi:glycosyltransferase involved in cell wall biosynthesis